MYQWTDKDNHYISENPRDAINGEAFMRHLSEFLKEYAIYVVTFFVMNSISFSYLILKGFFGYYGILTLPNNLTPGVILAIICNLLLFAITAVAMFFMKSVRNIWMASIMCTLVSCIMVALLIYSSLYFLSEVSNFGYLVVFMFRYEQTLLIVLGLLFFAFMLTLYIAMYKNVYHVRLTMAHFICVILIGSALFLFTLKPLGTTIARFDTTKDFVRLEDGKCLVVVGYASDQPLVMKCDIVHRVMRIKYQQGYFRLHDNDAVIQRDTFDAVILDTLFD